MEILEKAKNGITIFALKNINELNDKEIKQVKGGDPEHYKNFKIRYNKRGELLHVNGYEFTDEYAKELNKKEYDIIDVYTVLFKH